MKKYLEILNTAMIDQRCGLGMLSPRW